MTLTSLRRLLFATLIMMVVRIGLLVVTGLRTCHAFALPSNKSSFSTSTTALNANKFNPFTNMLGDVAESIMGGGSSSPSGPQDPKLDDTLSSLATPWEDVRSTLTSLQTPNERAFRESVATGLVASPLNKIRLFDASQSEKDIRVTFYRDSASWCPYCQKCWLTLEEKKIPYRVEKVNMRCYGEKPADFMRMQPSGQIPVAIIDGRTYGQSNEIMSALEEQFPQSKSLQPPRGQEARANRLLRLERQIFGAWMFWLTRGGKTAKAEFIETLAQVEQALGESDGPFFLGKDVTLVDFMYAPFLERMAASLVFFKGFIMRVPPNTQTDYPNLNKWFDGMETLESYQLTKSDYYTHCWDLPPQLGGCTYESGGELYEKAINGERSLDGTRGSWELPLQPHNNDGVEPDWTFCGDEKSAQREAVERLSANHEAIVAFAARGAGRKGFPGYSAMLADPNAVPNDAVKTGVSSVLQMVSMALLEGVDKHEQPMTKMADVIVKDGGNDYADGVVASLSYLRDRVGVPRDMRLPAARQLRAHLNWTISKILDAKG